MIRNIITPLFAFIIVGVFLLTTLYALPIPSPNEALYQRLDGNIILDVEGNGDAWYIIPKTHERIFLGSPEHAFTILKKYGFAVFSPYDALMLMQRTGIGASSEDLARIPLVNNSDKS